MSTRKLDPIERIEWRDANTLRGNHYNPNVVFNPELKLLERSILRTGWVQPILVSRAGTIIDGFHRWRLSLDSAAVRDRYQGRVPCVVMDCSEAEAMILTVRMNRAKGTHVAVRMSGIIKTLIDDHHMDPDQIALEIGGDRAEVDLLYQDDIFRARGIKDYRYSRAWEPRETEQQRMRVPKRATPTKTPSRPRKSREG